MGIGYTELAGDLGDGQTGERVRGRILLLRDLTSVVSDRSSALGPPATTGPMGTPVGRDRTGHGEEPRPDHCRTAMVHGLEPKVLDRGAQRGHPWARTAPGGGRTRSAGSSPDESRGRAGVASRRQRRPRRRRPRRRARQQHESSCVALERLALRWDAITTALGWFAFTAVVSARTDVLLPRTRHACPLVTQQDVQRLEPDGVLVGRTTREEQRCGVGRLGRAECQHLQPAADRLAGQALGLEVELPGLPPGNRSPAARGTARRRRSRRGCWHRWPGPARRALAWGRSSRTRPGCAWMETSGFGMAGRAVTAAPRASESFHPAEPPTAVGRRYRAGAPSCISSNGDTPSRIEHDLRRSDTSRLGRSHGRRDTTP